MSLAAFYLPEGLEAGCDEAGRGSLAGPVFAAAVVLPVGFENDLLDDSKKLSAKKRNQLRTLIEREALAWCVARVEAAEIDQINILNASIAAMHRAIAGLSVRPDRLLIDGNRFFALDELPHFCFVKGDGRYQSIAAASVLAKTHRDAYMQQLSLRYPGYGWQRNMGYPTGEHRKAIVALGPCAEHRRSFRLLDNQLSFDFGA